MIGDDFIKQYLIINIKDRNTEVLLISKSKKQYYIKQHINYKKGLKDLSENLYLNGSNKNNLVENLISLNSYSTKRSYDL